MAAEFTRFDLDYLVAEYRAGRTGTDLATELGVSSNVIYRRLKESGVELRPGANSPQVMLDAQEVLRLYDAGRGVSGIAKHFGCSTRPVQRILIENGVRLRNRSQQQAARMHRTSVRERKRLASAAHSASRGVPRSMETKIKVANTRYRTKSEASAYDFALQEALRLHGITADLQYPIGPYNCDLAIAPVAVEVLNGNWYRRGNHGAKFEDRVRHILRAGWDFLGIHIPNSRVDVEPAITNRVVSYVQERRRDKSSIRQYRMIWRAGKLTNTGRADDDQITLEPPFERIRDRRTGQFKIVIK